MMAVKMASTQDEILECFKFFDKDNDGYIEASELKQVMESLGEPLSMQEVSQN
jgi:Ca2+-binding EF-hand superfamily protein